MVLDQPLPLSIFRVILHEKVSTTESPTNKILKLSNCEIPKILDMKDLPE